MYRILILFIILFSNDSILPQKDADISVYLIMIEKGEADEVKEMLPQIKKTFPGAPSVYYLEGVLSEEGRNAVKLYKTVAEKYPSSTYADASLFRLYNYYSALDESETALEYSEKLKKNYSSSPYTKFLSGEKSGGNEKTSEYLYTIQAGAFANNTNAENLRRKMEKAGYFTFVKDKTVGGSVFKIVYTGRFKTRMEAEDFQVVLNKKYGLKGIITNYQE